MTFNREGFQRWQEFCRQIDQRSMTVVNSIQDRAWKLAATVDIPHDSCCLHNASIDDDMTGWCKDNPMRLKIAKRARHMMDNSWEARRIAERLTSNAWKRWVQS